MNFYKRHLGDYAKKTGRLSMQQHGAYNLLLDACYDREKFPTMDEAIEWAWASTESEIEAVKFVLSRFFVLTDGRYVQKRIAEEIEHYKTVAATNARIAAERETKRREMRTNRARSVHEAPPNHKPLTTNQEPTKREQSTGETVAPEDDPGALDPNANFFADLKPKTGGEKPEAIEQPSPTLAGKVCRSMRAAGFSSVNPGDVRFQALLAAGITEEEFVSAARDASKSAKSWGWILATVEGRRRDAAAAVKDLPGQVKQPQNARDRAAATAGALIAPVSRLRKGTATAFDFDLDTQGATHAKQIAQ